MSVEVPRNEGLAARRGDVRSSAVLRRRSEGQGKKGYWERLFEGYESSAMPQIFGGREDGEETSGFAERAFGVARMDPWVHGAEKRGVYFESLVVAAWALLISRYQRRNDVAFETLWARSAGHVRFPMRCRLAGEASVGSMVRAVEKQGRESMARALRGDPLRQPQLDTGVAFDVAGAMASDRGMVLEVEARRGGFRIHHQDSLVSSDAAERLLDHLANVLDQFAADATSTVREVCLLSEEEFECQVEGWNQTCATRQPVALHQRFEQLASASPEAIALVDGRRALTYQELDDAAGRLAYRLRHSRGVREGDAVAVSMRRSAEAMVAMLGVLKAGAVYVPVDPDYPEDRRERMTGKARCVLALVDRGEEANAKLPEFRVRLESLEIGGRVTAVARGSEDTACILFTSGSTGEPKGVEITHGNLLNNALSGIEAWELGDHDVSLQFGAMGFDVSLEETWTAWLSGGRLVLIEEQALASFGRFAEWVRSRGITVLNLPTAFWHSMVEAMVNEDARLPVSVRLLVVGGEEANAALYAKWRVLAGSGVGFVNAYGPAEATVTSTIFRDWVDERAFGSSLPIGRPVANAGHLVVDQHGNPQPVGVPGELWISGAGVARGYAGDRRQTMASFGTNPHDGLPGDRVYRTGDIVFADEGGQFHFVGRVDRQIKVRGFRIEPAEIEAALLQHPGVRAAYLRCVDEPGRKTRTIAYAARRRGSRPTEAMLLAHLKKSLPAYMEPNAVVVLPEFPRKANGKIDADNLPLAPPREASDRGIAVRKEERLLAEAWGAAVGTQPEFLEDDFFEMGGDSLAVISLLGAIHDRFHVRLPVAVVYNSPSLGMMMDRVREAVECRNGSAPCDWNALVTVKGGADDVRPLFLVHGIGGGILWGYRNLAAHLPDDLPVVAFTSRANDGLPEFADLESMVAHYLADLKRRQPEGPYRIGGYCLGGNIAHEMARQLRAEGEEVEILLLIDAYPFEERKTVMWVRSFRQAIRMLRNVFYKLRNAAGMPMKRKLARFRRLGRWGWHQVRERFGAIAPEQRNAEVVRTIADTESHTEEQLKLWEHHLRLFDGRVSGSYDGKAVLLRTRSQPVMSDYAEDVGWGRCLETKVVVRKLPGHHESIFLEPDVRTTALHVNHALGGRGEG